MIAKENAPSEIFQAEGKAFYIRFSVFRFKITLLAEIQKKPESGEENSTGWKSVEAEKEKESEAEGVGGENIFVLFLNIRDFGRKKMEEKEEKSRK